MQNRYTYIGSSEIYTNFDGPKQRKAWSIVTFIALDMEW